ncbi:MAG: TonB-dependent receptor [Acidobacteria bacterium]|nr:TonB-dependent receptor [Acidobacteriota bacterium]
MVLCMVLCALVIFSNQSSAQTATTLRVTVVDPSGAAIPQAKVQVVTAPAGAKKSAQKTNARGELTFNQLVAGSYQLQVSAPGFTPRTLNDIKLQPGSNQLEVRLEIAEVQEVLNVEQDKREANTDARGNAFSTVLTAEQIAQLPDDPDEFEQAIRDMAGPGATFRVNGFRGGHLPPKSQIREIRFRMNPYAAENHDAALIGVDIYTKPGLDSWHGSLNAGFRDEALNARNAFVPFRAPEQNRRFGFEIGGPLWRKHTSAFLSADGVNAYDSVALLAALPGSTLPTNILMDAVRRPLRTLNLAARVEHMLTKTHAARGEYQRNAKRQSNLGVGGFDLYERAYSSDSTEHILRLADSGSFGKKLFNEFRFQSRWQTVALDSLSNATTIQVLNAFTRGGAQLSSDRRVHDFDLADNLDAAFKKHALRLGVEAETGNYRSDEARNLNGTFVFSSLAAFNAGKPTQYSQRSGAGQLDFNQHQLGWFVQDDWRVSKGFSLNFGVRHEWQNNLADGNNFAPRFGFAYSPFRNGKTTLRGGAGIFYDWFGADTFEQALRVNGLQQRDLIVQQPCYPNPFACGQPVQLPPSRVQTEAGLQMPYSQVASFGIERELAKNMRLTTQYRYQRGVHLLRGRNINAPLPGAGRHDPTAGNITQIESSANSFNHALIVNLNWMKMGKFMLAANYVLSKSTNESDSPLSLPVNSFDLRGERGPSLMDARHRLFVLSNYTLPRGLRLGTILQASSATPYNVTTGFDNNGDSIINDRPLGLTRNSARGARRVDLSTRLSWGFGFGKAREDLAGHGPQVRVLRGDGDAGGMLGSMSGMPGAQQKRYRTEFFIQATNVLNHANLAGFSGVQTSPFFGRATMALPGRRLETGLRFSF